MKASNFDEDELYFDHGDDSAEAEFRFDPNPLPPVQADEIFIVFMVMVVWAAAVYIFFNQWGKF